MILVNDDVITQHIEKTIKRLANLNVNEGAGEDCVHIFALQQLCKYILTLDNELKRAMDHIDRLQGRSHKY